MPISPTFSAVAVAAPVTVAAMVAVSPTVAVEFTPPATLVTKASARAVPLVELAVEVAVAVTGNWIEPLDPAVRLELLAPMALTVSAMGVGS